MRTNYFNKCLGPFGAVMAVSGPSRRRSWILWVRVVTESGLDSFGNLLGARSRARGGTSGDPRYVLPAASQSQSVRRYTFATNRSIVTAIV